MKFSQSGYGDESYAPLEQLKKWLISDAEADSGDSWYEDPEPSSDEEEDDEAAARARVSRIYKAKILKYSVFNRKPAIDARRVSI